MKKLHVTNLTMNSNLAVYLGAYIGSIHKLALLNTNVDPMILYIIPYLKQMHMAYKIYADENTFIQDIKFFCPDAILSIADHTKNFKTLNSLVNTFKIDAIIVSRKNRPISDFHSENWYGVTIYNPATAQTTCLYHTDKDNNVPLLMKLNDYSSIHVESLPKMS